jgi:FlaA1/EpsC-like NDP-sugar epimerase
MHQPATIPVSQVARDYLRGKSVLVTGACGTIGQQLVRQLLTDFEVGALTGLDNNESELMFLEERHSTHGNTRFVLCDVRDLAALSRETRKVDVLFHTAAYKHVYLCERSPLEPIKTNVWGVQNVIQAAIDGGIERLVFASSDKAVNPPNVMGTSKLMAERLITAAALHPDHSGAVFLSTRFGNVLGSRGSVIPIFRDQIRRGGPVTLSDPRMTRFIMSLDQAVHLVAESVTLGRPGDVLITKMPAIRISDLAEVIVRDFAPRCGRKPSDIEIKITGPRPGEKIYEELMNEEETRRSFELDRYYVVRPASASAEIPDYQGKRPPPVDRTYNSANIEPMSQDDLARFLESNGLLDEQLGQNGRSD